MIRPTPRHWKIGDILYCINVDNSDELVLNNSYIIKTVDSIGVIVEGLTTFRYFYRFISKRDRDKLDYNVKFNNKIKEIL